MASITTIDLVDDLTGDAAQQTVEYELDGIRYEIDLSDENAGKLRAALADYVQKSRRVKRNRQGKPTRTALNGTNRRQDLTAVREWAKSNGYTVSERGRVAQHIVTAYDRRAATPAPSQDPVKLADTKPAEAPAAPQSAPAQPKPAVTKTAPPAAAQFSRATKGTTA